MTDKNTVKCTLKTSYRKKIRIDRFKKNRLRHPRKNKPRSMKSEKKTYEF